MQLLFVLCLWAVSWILAFFLAFLKMTRFVMNLSSTNNRTGDRRQADIVRLQRSIVYVFICALWSDCTTLDKMCNKFSELMEKDAMGFIYEEMDKDPNVSSWTIFWKYSNSIMAIVNDMMHAMYPTNSLLSAAFWKNILRANWNLFMWFVCTSCHQVYSMWNCEHQVFAIILGLSSMLVVTFVIYCVAQFFSLRNIHESMIQFVGVFSAIGGNLLLVFKRLCTKKLGYGTIVYFVCLVTALYPLLQHLYKLELYTEGVKPIREIAVHGCNHIIKWQKEGCKRTMYGWDENVYHAKDAFDFGQKVDELSYAHKMVINNEVSVPEIAMDDIKATPNRRDAPCPKFNKAKTASQTEVCIKPSNHTEQKFSIWEEFIRDVQDAWGKSSPPPVPQADWIQALTENIVMVFDHVDWPTPSTITHQLVETAASKEPKTKEELLVKLVAKTMEYVTGINVTLEE
jgi:hypothetical protein